MFFRILKFFCENDIIEEQKYYEVKQRIIKIEDYDVDLIFYDLGFRVRVWGFKQYYFVYMVFFESGMKQI